MALFTRDATGLVRGLGFSDQLILSLSCINVLGGFVTTIVSAPFFFPGANMLGVLMLGAIPAFAFVGMYSILSSAIPRSGGDYVWTGRILGPRFASSMAILFLFGQVIAFPALNAWLIISYCLAPGFLAFGLTTGNSSAISAASSITQHLTGYVLSVIILVIITAAGIFGLNVYKRVQRYTFVIYLVMLAFFLAALATVGSGAFQSSIDKYLGTYGVTYSSVLSAVSSNPKLSVFSLSNTILAFPLLGFLTYSGFNFNTYASGETKSVSKTIPRALVLAVLITMLALFVEMELTLNTMGSNFVGGISYLWNTGKLGTLPVEPTVTFLVALGVNPYVGFIVNLGYAVGNFLVALASMFLFSRIIFAMSFDRILPSKFADVNDRFHSPVNAMAIVGVLAVIVEALYWYGPGLLTGYLDSSVAVDVAYMIPGIGAFLLPLVRKDLYQRVIKPLPGWLGKSIGGWPLVSFCGFCVTLIWAFGIYTELVPVTNYTYLGASLDFALGATIVPIIAALILFEGARAYHRRKDNVDIVMSFREIPPE